MNRLLISLLIATMSFSLVACTDTSDDTGTDEETEAMEETSEDSEDGEEMEEDEVEEEEEMLTREPGETPFDYPLDVVTTAESEDFVLTPSRSTLDSAFEDEDGRSTMIFYSRVLIEAGDNESIVKEFSEEVSIPNSLLVPIPAGATAVPGDIVLTWWQSGSGMTRAIIVEGGTEREPMAKYLDLSFDYEPETLKLDSFHVLTEELAPGTTVAVKDGGEYVHEIVINVSGDKALTSGFASILEVRDTADLIPAPINPEVEVGDTVFIPVIGTYESGKVTEIDAVNGRITVEYEWAGSTSEEAFPYGDVVIDL